MMGRLVRNRKGSSGWVAKGMACARKIGTKKLYEHIIAQLRGEDPQKRETSKLTLELPGNPPNTPQEWKSFCAQIRTAFETANHMETELAEAKRK